jgi:spore coat protein H
MKKTLNLITILYITCFLPALSQPSFPPNIPVFDSSVVARVDITINPDTLDWLYDHVESDLEFHATFQFDNGTINETMDNIGFRLRGNTSRYSQKKSFKVSFNTFEAGRKFYGLEKMNLNGEHNDPSVIRARICWDWLRAMNVPAPRSTHARVYINGNYYGLYIIVENIDEEFAKSRFGNKDGNLYKCLYPADLKYLGANPDLYKLTNGNRRVYELTQNEELDDYSDLANFISVLNNTPLQNLETELQKIFNLNDYLKIMALDVITGNWDGYIYNKNNFYLYHNTRTGRFEYIPYDLDNTLGIDWLDRDWGTRNIYDWEQHAPEVRPLYTRLLDVPAIRDQYSFYMKQLLDLLSDEDSLFAAIDQVRIMITGSVASDPYYPLDYGYTYADFQNSYNQALGGHVDYGLKPYIQTRVATALQQLVLNAIQVQAPLLFINELMADNDTTIADEYGEYDNWAEIYNGDDEAVWLGDKYLSDNLSNPDKWQLPNVTMQPGTFLIIWADGQPEQGPFHASYKLNDEGEELGIFNNEISGYALIDSVSWGMQEIDISYGRETDGGVPWIFFNFPTPGASNKPIGVSEIILSSRIGFYPNPVSGGIIYFKEPFSGIIMDSMGRTLWKGESVMNADVSGWPAGLYFMMDSSGNKAKALVP